MREIPGLRKRERTWKDEVRERVRHRRQQRSGGEELPLFRDTEEAPPEEPEAEAVPLAAASSSPDAAYEPGPRELGDDIPSEAMHDLPLRRFDGPVTEPEPMPSRGGGERFAEAEPAEPALEDEDDDVERDWRLDAAMAAADPRPVERPAHAGERAQAALVDVILILGVWAMVVYFASRAARVSLAGLQPSWPYLVSYLAFLGLAYAACFTGITGQTLGKMLKGLRVVTASGRPPGCPRAFLRATLGSLGVILAFSGTLPMFFDPARRGFHDRLLKTRVVKG
jgi:uncharacterized RDD family membrane protein YckC